MFNLREFIMQGFRDAIGKMADYQIILNSAGWNEKNVLTNDDLAEIQTLITLKNTIVEEPPIEPIEEEPPTEPTQEE